MKCIDNNWMDCHSRSPQDEFSGDHLIFHVAASCYLPNTWCLWPNYGGNDEPINSLVIPVN